MAADSNFLQNLGVLGQTNRSPVKPTPAKSSKPDPGFMQNIGAFGNQSAPAVSAPKPADRSFMQNLNAFAGSRPESGMQTMMREAGRTDIQRGLLDDGSFGFKDVYGRPLMNGKVQGLEPERTILPPQETRVVPGSSGGIVQTGKNLGGGGTPINMARSFDALLQGVGQQPFGGSQLPTAMGNPYTATYKQTAGFGEDIPDIGGMNGATYDSEGGTRALNATNLQDMAPFNPGAPLIEGGSERIAQQSTGISSGRLSDALEGVKTQEANREMTPERRQQMASMAFLNGEDSMSGLKARDAVNDVVYAGGQHYGRGALTEDGKIGDKYKIDRADARDIASGKQSAAGLLDVYKSRITESAKSTTPVEAQEPIILEKPGVKQSFSRTETITPGIDTSIPDTTAFNSNNGVDVPGFGKTGGYKPTSKKPEVDYSSIFSY